MKKEFSRSLHSLEAIHEFVKEFSLRNGLDETLQFLIDLVVEEIFTNMVKYNPESRENIQVGLRHQPEKLSISLIDLDSEPFDLNKAEAYDAQQSLKERPVGGVGIHLVRKMMDKIDYQYRDRKTTITLTKYLRP